jgi:hypothetical protein
MEPRHEDQTRTAASQQEARPKRFRLVRLEERVAPSTSVNTAGFVYRPTAFCTIRIHFSNYLCVT